MLEELKILKDLLPSLQTDDGAVAILPGDDCAGIKLENGKMLLLAVDQLIASVHYDESSTSPEAAARKLLNRNLSDIAAMGGVPSWALLAVAAADEYAQWVREFCLCVGCEAQKAGVSLIGGDIASQKAGFTSSLTIAGTVDGYRAVTRNGASPGDGIYVTGMLGNTLETMHHLNFIPRLGEGKFLAEGGFAGAMIDISDGLYLDLERVLTASKVGAMLDLTKLPLREGADIQMALSDGEDYELLFTVQLDLEAELRRSWRGDFAPITRIGEVIACEGQIVDLTGKVIHPERSGYEH